MANAKISDIANQESSALSDTDLFEGEEGGGTSFKVAASVLKSSVQSGIVTYGDYKLVSSISANDLVLALKDVDGNDFTAARFLTIKLSDTKVTISAALSVTKADGTNWADLGSTQHAAKDVDLFAYLINETGASAGVKLGWSRIPHGTLVSDFSSTTTAEKYLAGPTNYNATDKVQNIGRFNATLSAAGSGHLWTIPATSIIKNSPTFNTRWLNWQPDFTASSGTYTSVTTSAAKYMIENRKTSLIVFLNGTLSGTPLTARFSLPFAALSALAQVIGTGQNATTGETFTLYLVSTTVAGAIRYNASNWPTGAGAIVDGMGFYEI